MHTFVIISSVLGIIWYIRNPPKAIFMFKIAIINS